MSEPIVFSRSLYEADAIRAAIEAFADLARFEVVEHANDITVRIADADPEVAHLADEFGNYALIETITRRSSAAGPSPESPR